MLTKWWKLSIWFPVEFNLTTTWYESWSLTARPFFQSGHTGFVFQYFRVFKRKWMFCTENWWWLVSNPGTLLSVATALPTLPEPLPSPNCFKITLLMTNPGLFFFYFCLFNTELIQLIWYKICRWLVSNRVLWCQKQLLCQLFQNHCPPETILK